MTQVVDYFKATALLPTYLSRNRRTHILVDGDPSLSQLLCAQIEEFFIVDLLHAPHEVLVMNRVRENARGSLFNLGEALLTECKVQIQHKAGSETAQGIGLVLGENRDLAYELAVIDAAFNLLEPLPQHELWIALLKEEEEHLEARRIQERRILDTTHVEFSSMLTEEDNKEGIH